MMIILGKSSFLGSNYAVKQKMTMKTIGMVIIIMFPTLQCLDPWEFAVRLSQQRCPLSPVFCSAVYYTEVFIV